MNQLTFSFIYEVKMSACFVKPATSIVVKTAPMNIRKVFYLMTVCGHHSWILDVVGINRVICIKIRFLDEIINRGDTLEKLDLKISKGLDF